MEYRILNILKINKYSLIFISFARNAFGANWKYSRRRNFFHVK